MKQESTISNKEEEESSTFSDMSKQDSESDINVDDTQDQEIHKHQKHCKFILCTTQQCMIQMIQYMMNMIHQKIKI